MLGSDGHDGFLDELRQEREIRDALVRYCRGVDRRDMDLVRSAYHEDAYDDHGSFAGNIDEFVSWLNTRHEHIRQSMHCLAQTQIERRGPVAAVETYCVAYSTVDQQGTATRARYLSDPSLDTGEPLQVTTCVRYVDRFERRESQWRIARRTVLLETMRWQYVPEQLPPQGGWATKASRGPDDASWPLFDALRA